MNGSAKVLITGVGCVGKSTLRRRVGEAFGRKVVCIDRDDAESEPEVTPGQVLVIESVHGLDEPPESWGLVVYLLPPRGHTLRWIRRGIAWFRTGQVDRPPRVNRRPWSFQNIPLIVRLVGRNVWNAPRWVDDDRKRIEEFYPNCSIVTDDVEQAFRKIEHFIYRTKKNGDCMINNTGISEETLKEWVRDSIELDLIYDEEQEPPSTFTDLLLEPNTPLDYEDDFKDWYKYFFDLKSIRIKVSLELDGAGIDYALKNAYKDEKELCLRLKKVKGSYINKLNSITRRCTAAIGILWQKEQDGKINKEEATLIALFHSELCASSTKDVSWGQAKSFTITVPLNAIGYSIFQWIARHNVARGSTHLGLLMEAVKTIDHLVDNFFDRVNDLAKEINCEKDISILIRALFFPASKTLSQALGDMQRHTERRYYLEKALAKAEEFDYWKSIFKLLLFVERLDTKSTEKSEDFKELRDERAQPRIVSERKEALSRFPIELDDTSKWKKLWESNGINDSVWRESEEWRFRWHSAESQQLGRHIKTMAEKVISVFDIRGASLQPKDKKLIEIIMDVFYIAHTTLEGFKKENGYVYWLLGEDEGFNKVSPPEIKHIWLQGSVLYSALKEVVLKIREYERKYGTKNSRILAIGGWNTPLKSLDDWKMKLKHLIENEAFKDVRSEVDRAEKLQECQRPFGYEESKCLHDKCNECDVSCPKKLLLLNEKNSNNSYFAPPSYYFEIMSSQQERFLSYLKYRTGRKRYYRPGEAIRPSPCFEIICLRRWNSFSPNLGSRATATVGGGYFVRAWDGSKERYIGIVIDPGYNFLENLFNEGFTIADVDLVVITHAHPDHIENFTNLLTLLRERDKRLKGEDGDPRTSPREHRILLAMTEGVFERITVNLTAEGEFIEDIVVLSAKEFRGNNAGKCSLDLWLDDDFVCHMDLRDTEATDRKVSLRAARAWHNDYTGYDTIGVVIEYQNCENDCKDNNLKNIKKRCQKSKGKKVGIIGDSRYRRELYSDYENCEVLVTHVGGLVDEKMYKDFHKTPDDTTFFNDKKLNENLLELLTKKNHLYLPGIALLICDLQDNSNNGFPLMILSEFGEELRGGLRKDFAKRLECFWKEGSQNRLPIIPGDVGLRIDIDRKKVFCCICHRYEEPTNINSETVMPDEESMAYVCLDCKELRGGELNTLLEEWCRTARPVLPLERPKRSNGPNKD